MPASAKLFFTLQEVADLLSLHPKTVGRYSATGEIPAIKVGGIGNHEWRVRSDWLDQWAGDNMYDPRGGADGRGQRSRR
ncbi:helix-turn-helix domain-containing protein [Kocuria arenosa]|uniref:helix-turn-helix domain-containing protein n=1 Tax=Kocuria arenosa TaxID=3071446 RepID=UPI0034D61C99